VFYRGAEYLLAKQPFNWHSVSLACQMMGAHLLSIHSRDELHFIKERLRRVSHAMFNSLIYIVRVTREDLLDGIYLTIILSTRCGKIIHFHRFQIL